jgi:hypothetical protein
VFRNGPERLDRGVGTTDTIAGAPETARLDACLGQCDDRATGALSIVLVALTLTGKA